MKGGSEGYKVYENKRLENKLQEKERVEENNTGSHDPQQTLKNTLVLSHNLWIERLYHDGHRSIKSNFRSGMRNDINILNTYITHKVFTPYLNTKYGIFSA